MEVVVSNNWTTGAISRAKLQSNHHHQQTNIHFFYRPDARPVAQPTVSKHWRENITFHRYAYPKLTWGSSNFVSDHWWLLVTLREGCHASHQPSDASIPWQKGIWPVKTECWYAGVGDSTDSHHMSRVLIVTANFVIFCCSKIKNGRTFWLQLTQIVLKTGH